jgi:hypothetical protein
MPHREFEAARREASQEPITFSIAGEEEPFRCVPILDWETLEETVRYHLDGNQIGMALQIGPFFRKNLIEEDVERFFRMLSRKDRRLSPEVLIDVMTWIIEQHTGRPTERPSGSPGGPQATGDGSRGPYSSAVTTEGS